MDQPTPEERFWDKVDKNGPLTASAHELGPCWLWIGSRGETGYGHVKVNRRMRVAHRVAFEMVNGPIPEGMEIDHMCFTRACVNPAHLRTASRKQNGEYRSGAQVNNLSSHVRNVYREDNGWRVQIKHNGRRMSFGTYATIAEAESVAVRERARLFTFPEAEAS